MDETEVLEQRYRFFTEKGVQIAIDYSKTLTTLFTGIFAGLITLVTLQKVGFWAGVCFLVADTLAVFGLAYCLFHMSLSSKLMSTYAALFGGEDSVPNLLLGDKPTEQALRRFHRYVQHCHFSQLMYLFLTVLVAAVGLATMLWDQVRMIGLLVGLLFALVLVAGVLFGATRRGQSCHERGQETETADAG